MVNSAAKYRTLGTLKITAMKNVNVVRVNFPGGVIPPDDLYNILVAATKSGILYVRFGLRQQLLIDVSIEELAGFTGELEQLGLPFEVNSEEHPNIVSSCPADDIFILQSWLTEETYELIFHSFNYSPKLKVNISDSNQSFTPLLTGNINWVASENEKDYWHLFVRFPKTNVVYEWKDLVHTGSLAGLSGLIEDIILEQKNLFYDNSGANGDLLYEKVKTTGLQVKPATAPADLPAFKLPYYEGLNRYGSQYWLGIYRRDELFSVKFLKEVCRLCVESERSRLFSTPWKTIIIKGITESERQNWVELLDKYQVNVRHAQNELNFQVDDNSPDALKLKQYLVKYLNDDDTRTFGVCIGIKTKQKSEVFSSILVRRKPLLRIGGKGFFHLYDILCAKDFNPNERTDFAFSKDNPRFLLAEQLRRAVLSFYRFHGETAAVKASLTENDKATAAEL